MDGISRLSRDQRELLEQRLRRARQSAEQRSLIATHVERSRAPVSFAQRQMWLIDQMAPGNVAYNMPNGFRLKGHLDVEALEGAINDVVARHEILRTTFEVRDGEPSQLIHPAHEVALETIGLDDLPIDEREMRLRALAVERATRSFDLARLPLIRVFVFRLNENENVLIVNLHHIVGDGLSIKLLMNEIDAHYRARTVGTAPRVPQLTVQYADYARWQRETMAGDDYADQMEYWRTELAGPLPVLELPCDKLRPPIQSFRGGNVFFNVPSALAQELGRVGAREGCSPFMTMLAALSLLLYRYSGAEDILIGVPISMRNFEEVQGLIGNFLNIVALRCDLSGDPTFVELLRRSRETSLAAFSNSQLPFDVLIKNLKCERDPSRNPIFQVLLQILSADVVSEDRPEAASLRAIGDIEIENFHFDFGVAQVDLALHLYDEPAGYVGRFEYCTDLFERQTIERLSGSFEELLRAVVANPQEKISSEAILPLSETRRLLDIWNATSADYPAESRMHELFEARAQATPARVAMKAEGSHLSYCELDAQANRIAHVLRARTVGRGQRVGLCVERGADMLASVLGILKSGAAYVPLDPWFPAERLRFMAEDAELSVLVATTRLSGFFDLPREKQLLLDADVELISCAPCTHVAADEHSAQPADPAYVIYTSGSTGKPKGVVVPHRAVVNFLVSMAREPGLAEDDVLAAVTTLSFDIAVLELHLPLTLGATTVIATRHEATDGRALRQLLEREQVTAMQATPSTWRLLLDAGWRGRPGFKALVGGEAMPKDLAEDLIALGLEIWNLYGPTETTVWSTCARLRDTKDAITIGRPISNTTVRILDSRGAVCPVGVSGELCIGGAGVALGYWKRPDLTDERFVADRFSDATGDKLYRTGDRARWRNDGFLEYLGRFDDQVKVRGFRIELGEIEAVLTEHPDVQKAAVHLWSMKPNDVRIVACCVPPDGRVFGPGNLRKHLRARLPEYMIPQHFVPVDALPLTPNGKVDRRRLPTPIVADGVIGRYEAASDSVEAAIAEIWTSLIKPTQPIGRFDKFFDIGGHSLLGIQALRQIEHRMGVRLDFATLFSESLAEIATQCRSAGLLSGNNNMPKTS